MDNNVKVSVIIPIYNSEEYLHKCIDSVLAQTYENFELLLINDGSKDSSGTICDEYAEKDKRVRVFHQENAGVSAARNKGLDNARGRWVTFIDSDDWVKPKYIETFFKQNNYPSKALVQQGHITIGIDGGKNDERNFQNKIFITKDISDIFSEEQFIKLMPFPWAKLYDFEIVKRFNIKFPLGIHFGEDLLFVLEYMKYIESFILNSSNLLSHELGKGSLSFKINSFESELLRFNIMKDHLYDLSKIHNLSDKAVAFNNSYMARSLYRAISALYYHNDKTKKEIKDILQNLATNENVVLIKDSNFLGKAGFMFKILFTKNKFNMVGLYFTLYFKYKQIRYNIK